MIPGFNIVSGSIGYRAPAVNFSKADSSHVNKTSSYWTADTKILVCSVWFRTNDLSVVQALIGDSDNGTFIFLNTNGGMSIRGNANPGNILDISLSAGTFTTNQWYHLLLSVDMANSSNRHIYINDVAQSPTYNIYTDGTIAWTRSTWSIGSRANGVDLFWSGDIADFYIDTGTYVDISDKDTRRNYISERGKPVDLNSLATRFLFTKDSEGAAASTWNNVGAGGSGTHNGVITNSAGSPSD